MSFNDKLMELRKLKGWSQEELGNRLNVSRQTVSKWELGSTTPEMEKLIEISRIFEISIDVLVDNIGYEQPSSNEIAESASQEPLKKKKHFEYVSKSHIGKLPLVHINLGFGAYKAKGVIAIGIIAMGFLSLGIVSVGLFSLGAVCVGLLAFGGVSIGGAALGGIALGGLAFGGVAVGYFAIGGLSLGVYSIGGCAVGARIALGGYSYGHISIGDIAEGAKVFDTDKNTMKLLDSTVDDLRKTILEEFPNTLKFIVDLFCSVVK